MSVHVTEMLLIAAIMAASLQIAVTYNNSWPYNNIAPFSRVKSSSTCGDPPSTYCPLVDPSGFYGQLWERCYICDSSEKNTSHPIENVLNGKKTWWQSENNVKHVTITFDLIQVYSVTGVTIVFGPSPNPRQWVLEKSIDGRQFTPWRYFGDKKYCHVIQSALPKNSKIKCLTNNTRITDREEVIVQLVDDDRQTRLDDQSLEFIRASHVRFRFEKMQTLHGNYVPAGKYFSRRLYYTVRSVEIYVLHLCEVSIAFKQISALPCDVGCSTCEIVLLNDTGKVFYILEDKFNSLKNANTTAVIDFKHNLKIEMEKYENWMSSNEITILLLQHGQALLNYYEYLNDRVDKVISTARYNEQLLYSELHGNLNYLKWIVKILLPENVLNFSVIDFDFDTIILDRSLQWVKTRQNALEELWLSQKSLRSAIAFRLKRILLLNNCSSDVNRVSYLKDVNVTVEIISVIVKSVNALKDLNNAVFDTLKPINDVASGLINKVQDNFNFLNDTHFLSETGEILKSLEKRLRENAWVFSSSASEIPIDEFDYDVADSDYKKEIDESLIDYDYQQLEDLKLLVKTAHHVRKDNKLLLDTSKGLENKITKLQVTHESIVDKLSEVSDNNLQIKNTMQEIENTINNVNTFEIHLRLKNISFPVNKNKTVNIMKLSEKKAQVENLSKITYLSQLKTISFVIEKIEKASREENSIRDLTVKLLRKRNIEERRFGNLLRKKTMLKNKIKKAKTLCEEISAVLKNNKSTPRIVC